MKLISAVEMARCCGLHLLTEAVSNVLNHSMNLFKYDRVEVECAELTMELQESVPNYKNKTIEEWVEENSLEWYYETEQDKEFDCPKLRPKST